MDDGDAGGPHTWRWTRLRPQPNPLSPVSPSRSSLTIGSGRTSLKKLFKNTSVIMAKVLGPLSADVNLGDEEQTRQLGRVDIVAEETCDTGDNDDPLRLDQAALVTAEGPTLDTQQPGCFILSESQLPAPAKQRDADVLHVGVLIHGCAQRKSCHCRSRGNRCAGRETPPPETSIHGGGARSGVRFRTPCCPVMRRRIPV